MYDLAHRINAKSSLNALRQTYSIAASASAAARARALAPTIAAIRPGIYTVGGSTVDFWREACTCKEARARTLRGTPPTVRPCPHVLALYLAGEWIPGHNPTEYLKSVEIEQPEVLAMQCRATLPACYPPAPKGYLILEACDDYATLENIATGTHATIDPAALRNLRPIYGEV